MGELYADDILLWSERQASATIAGGEPVNERPDWVNIIEEVESVGREQLHAVESLLLRALAHMLKAQGWPEARDAPNWQADARRRCGRTSTSPASTRMHLAPSPREWTLSRPSLCGLPARCPWANCSAERRCPTTASATCSVSPPGARATGRRSAAWSTAARRASRFPRPTSSPGWTADARASRASPRNGRSRTRCASCPACSTA